MRKDPFVFDHTTKNSPLEGVTIPAGAQEAVRQRSTPASGRGDALEGGDSCAMPPPFQRREVGVRTSHTTAAERLSSTRNNAATQRWSSTPENRSPGRTLQTLRRRGRPCEREGFPLRLGASRRVLSPIACLAGGRVRRPVAGFVLRGKASRSAVPGGALAYAV